MNLADPNDLNGDRSTRFTFPYVSIEDPCAFDDHTLRVANDNHDPGGGGRNAGSDPTEFLRIKLNTVPEPVRWALMGGGPVALGLGRRRRRAA